MAKNSSLNAASVAKQDEFYTQYKDIQSELNNYTKHFADKTVLCNCDDPFESNFCKFFLRNFNYLKLKRLICTSYSASPIVGQQLTLVGWDEEPIKRGNGYVMDISEIPMANGRGISDSDIDSLLKSKKSGVKRLKGDGDFRSDECIEYMKQADIVVTNPPFSLFREYVALLMKYDKKFLIIGNQNNITYKEIFPLIQENKIWLGCKYGDMAFRVPDYYKPRNTRYWEDENGQKWRSFGTICWYTNLDHQKRHEDLVLYKNYYGNEEDYPKYDNYDAINVNKVANIPKDYFECMAVPITYVDKHNPNQFEIINANDIRTNPDTPIKAHGLIKDKDAVITTQIYAKNAEKDLTQTAKTGTILTDRQTDRQTELSAIKLIQYVFGYAVLPLGKVANVFRGEYITKKNTKEGTIPVILGGQEPAYYIDKYNHDGEIVVVARSGASAGFVSYWNQKIFVTDGFGYEEKSELITTKFLYYVLKNMESELNVMKRGAGVPHVSGEMLNSIELPIPSLQDQQRMVEILDRFDTLCNDLSAGLPAEIEARQKQYEYYRDRLLSFKELPK